MDVTINSPVTWWPTQTGADQWNRTPYRRTRGVARPGEPLGCQLHEFMAAIGPVVGIGSGAAMPASRIVIGS